MSNQLPSFAIMGTGGVGGYFGARLARAGYPVAFVARGEHLAAIRASGLTIETADEIFTVEADADDDPARIGPVDFVFFCVKLWDTAEAGLACKPLIGPDTAVVSLQNGVDSETDLAAILGAGHVMGGVAEISAFIAEPGKIRLHSKFQRIRFGELDGTATPRAGVLAAALKAAGIDVDQPDDIVAAIWNKFVFLTGLSAMTALTRQPIGAVRQDPDTRAMLAQIMSEVIAVASAGGISLADQGVESRMRFVDTLPAGMRASMAEDLSLGKRLELPWLSGAVVRMGRERGVPTPANAFVVTALKLQQDGTP